MKHRADGQQQNARPRTASNAGRNSMTATPAKSDGHKRDEKAVRILRLVRPARQTFAEKIGKQSSQRYHENDSRNNSQSPVRTLPLLDVLSGSYLRHTGSNLFCKMKLHETRKQQLDAKTLLHRFDRSPGLDQESPFRSQLETAGSGFLIMTVTVNAVAVSMPYIRQMSSIARSGRLKFFTRDCAIEAANYACNT